MTEIEKYAIENLSQHAEGGMEDDIDEDGVLNNEEDWEAAVKLGVDMAVAIRERSAEFLAWYRTGGAP